MRRHNTSDSTILPSNKHGIPRTGLALVLALILFIGILTPFGAAEARDGYPNVLNIFLSNDLTSEEIDLLAKWDILCLDADFPFENPGGLAQIRALNPDVVILAYLPINGASAVGGLRPPATVAYQLYTGIDQGGFWLRDINGDIVSDWDGKVNSNVSSRSGVNGAGQDYAEWFANFVNDVVWQQGTTGWDGVMLDDVWDTLHWLNNLIPAPIDANLDGIADSADSLNTWWVDGNRATVERLRELVGPSVPLFSNGANSHFAPLNGTMIENFPFNGAPDQGNHFGYAWRRWMTDAPEAYLNVLPAYNPSPMPLTTINAYYAGDRAAPDHSSNFERHKRLTLGSALLGDGWYSLDNDRVNHFALWWEPEYDIYLGDPLGPAYTVDVGGKTMWRREYEAGIVVVNPNNTSGGGFDPHPLVSAWDAYIGPRPDLVLPDPVSVISAGPVSPTSALLLWEAPQDGPGARVSDYRVKRSESEISMGLSWIQADLVPEDMIPKIPGEVESLLVEGLAPNTTYHLAVRSYDAWNNISDLTATAIVTTPPTGDVMPPRMIDDITQFAADTVSVTVNWTAPGDDSASGTAATYQGRVDTNPIDSGSWDVVEVVTGLPAPAAAGTVQQFTLTGLEPATTYYLALRAQDESGNLGALPASVPVTTDSLPPPPADTTPPGSIDDLALVSVDTTSALVSWTAPGDDGTIGTATSYHGRLHSSPITLGNWDTVPPLAGLPTPTVAGTPQQASLGNLTPASTYYLSLRAEDDAGNLGPVPVNLVVVTDSLPPPPPPVDTTPPAVVGDLSVTGSGKTWLQLGFTAPLDSEGEVTAYQLRRVDGASFPENAWDGATPVTTGTPLAPGQTESILAGGLTAETGYSFRMRAVDDAGNWSALSNAVAGTTDSLPPPPPPDTVGPAAVADLAVTGTGETSLGLAFTAPADSAGSVVEYELRYLEGTGFPEASWDAATPVTVAVPQIPGNTESPVVTGLDPATSYTLRVRSRDNSGNWSGLSNPATGTTDTPPPPEDTEGPAPVSDLAVADVDTHRVRLTWTAPADAQGSVTGYRIRFVPGTAFPISAWNGATALTTPTPAAPGAPESMWAQGLTPQTTYSFRIQSVDDSGNWSGLSAPASGTTSTPPPPDPTVDLTPPNDITDFSGARVDSFDVLLGWTAPGDDGTEGVAAQYEIRWMEEPFVWADAQPLDDPPTPAPSGTQETLRVVEPPRDKILVFAIRAEDESGNVSGISNLVAVLVPSPEPPPDTQAPGAILGLDAQLGDEGIALLWQPAPEADVAGYRLYRGRANRPMSLHREIPGTTFQDQQVIPGRSYRYAVTAVDEAGNEGARSTEVHMDVPRDSTPIPESFLGFGDPFPNPSTGPVSLEIETTTPVLVLAEVFDIRGRRIRSLREQSVTGAGTLRWDGRDDSGVPVGRGLYFLRVSAGEHRTVRKVVIR